MPYILDFDVREAGLLRYFEGPDWITEEFQFDSSVAERVLRRIIEHPQANGQIENMTRVQDMMYMNLTGIRERAAALVESLEQSVIRHWANDPDEVWNFRFWPNTALYSAEF